VTIVVMSTSITTNHGVVLLWRIFGIFRRRTFVSAAPSPISHIQRIGHWRADHNKY
jgi:hypothetical protein